MISTYTRTETNTYTQARANYVMEKVYEDTLSMVMANVINGEKANNWRKSLLYLLNLQVIDYFQFQFYKSDGTTIGGLHYECVSNGYIYSDEDSGGIDFWGLPSGVHSTLLVSLDHSSPKINEANETLKKWGWGTGKALNGAHHYSKSYSKDGYGLKQNIIGKW